MAKEKDKSLTLEDILWECRVALRGVGSLDKNRDAVISLVFLKFAGDKFARCREQVMRQFGDNPAFLENPAFYNAENVFYLKETARWDYIVRRAGQNDIAIVIDKAMADIEADNETLAGALSKNLFSTLGADRSKIKSLIDSVNRIDESRFHEDDLIGRVYEYFLQIYAASGTKEDGEFYTPACIVKLIAELLEPFDGVVYDPCCGSGGMFVQSMKFVDRHNGNRDKVSIIGQESVQETWRLCKMNLAIRGIAHDLGKTNASTFTGDQHKDMKVDYIMANPPFNLKNWRTEKELAGDARWSGYCGQQSAPRVSNANYAWILHMISKLDVSRGVAGFLLANGALGDMDDWEIRRNILLKDRVEAIIVLPRDMFYTTDISVTLWIVAMNKRAGTINGRKVRGREREILFMDLRAWDGNVEEIAIDKGKRKKKTVLTDSQIAKVKETYNNWQSEDRTLYHDEPEFCKSVKVLERDLTEEEAKSGAVTVEGQNWALMPSKYIDFIDHDMDIDYRAEMRRIQAEMAELVRRERESQEQLAAAFKGIGYGIE